MATLNLCRILPKLQLEANIQGSSSKNAKTLSTVDTHRGETYQFCYFIRSVEPHSVAIKTRLFVAAPIHPKPKLPPAPSKPPAAPAARTAKRKAPPAKKVPKKKKWKGKKKASSEDMDEDTSEDSSSDIYISDDDEEMERDMEETGLQDEQPAASTFDLEMNVEEKPKPILQLKYQGFQIYGKCLCVVVEPWPLPPKNPKSINVLLGSQHTSRLSAPPRPGPGIQQAATVRGETPLFLPDDDVDVPEFPQTHSLFTIDKDNESDEEEDDPFANMIAYSQALKNTNDERPGAVAVDDEDMDTGALFGDADEIRELR